MNPEWWALNGDMCRACLKPLRDEIGPTVTDRAGNRYHFPCWRVLANPANEAARATAPKGRRKPARAALDVRPAPRASA
jgi:hypothetical protein